MLIKWRPFVAALAGLLVIGCVEYEERLQLRPDGSGVLEVHYRGPDDANLTDNFPPEDESELRKELERRYVSEHVRLMDCSMEERDGDKVIDFALEFDQLTALNAADPLFWDAHYEIQKTGSRLRVERILKVDAEDNWSEPAESRFEEWLKSEISDKVLRRFRFRFEIAMPRRVLETNAGWVRGGKVAVWNYRLSDVIGRRKIMQFVIGQ